VQCTLEATEYCYAQMLEDKSQRTIVHTQFQDEVLDVRSEVVIDMPKMTGVQYEKKVCDFLTPSVA